jgi:hypothetical protein
MKPSLAFTLAVLFFQAIPLFEARPLRLGTSQSGRRNTAVSNTCKTIIFSFLLNFHDFVDADKADHPHLSLLPRTSTPKEAGKAPVVDCIEPGRRSVDGEEGALPGQTDDVLQRPAARSPPSPQGSNPPHYRQPDARRWDSGPWVGGSRTPSRPPAPSGKNPPHWRWSGGRFSRRPVDVFHVLGVLSKMF